jgi:hypothetical protein
MLKRLLHELRHANATLIGNPTGALKQSGIYLDGSCWGCSH